MDLSLIAGILTGLGGLLGGITLFYQARKEVRASLSASEATFRQSLIDELKPLKTENKELTKQAEAQGRENYKLAQQVMMLAATVDRYTVVQGERDLALRRLQRCEDRAEQDRKVYETRITELETQVAGLQAQVEELTRKVEPDEQQPIG